MKKWKMQVVFKSGENRSTLFRVHIYGSFPGHSKKFIKIYYRYKLVIYCWDWLGIDRQMRAFFIKLGRMWQFGTIRCQKLKEK